MKEQLNQSRRTALIIGAGPAGLTAALELLRRTDVRPIVVEASNEIGGLSRTVEYKGNRIDIGGHRFFSKSDWVMDWWRQILPVQPLPDQDGDEVEITYRNKKTTVRVPPEDDRAADPEKVMLIRSRLSRIYFLRKFFDYPVRLSLQAMLNLGPLRMVKIGLSYARSVLFPRRPVRSLEDFIINRFGRELYLTFFKDYTEKVWGVPCDRISPEWGAQRIKGLSIARAVLHAARKILTPQSLADQKKTQTSLIERFMYPKYGPGQLWQEVARQVRQGGGEILFGRRVAGMKVDGDRVVSVRVTGADGGESREFEADFVFSTMPVKDLVLGLQPPPPPDVVRVAAGLPYRDFITVGILAGRMRANPQSRATGENNMPPDNWIYIQESDVRVGRLQIFNNWSPWLVRDEGRIWLGLEYFCSEDDDLWKRPDDELKALAAEELERIGLIDRAEVQDSVVIRVPKAYPAYFGTYPEFDVVRRFVDAIGNLFLVGRNGMHRYNNQDHSMLTARLAVECVAASTADKDAIWAVNIDDDYHEERKPEG